MWEMWRDYKFLGQIDKVKYMVQYLNGKYRFVCHIENKIIDNSRVYDNPENVIHLGYFYMKTMAETKMRKHA